MSGVQKYASSISCYYSIFALVIESPPCNKKQRDENAGTVYWFPGLLLPAAIPGSPLPGRQRLRKEREREDTSGAGRLEDLSPFNGEISERSPMFAGLS